MQKTHTQSMLLSGKIILQYLRACTSPLYSNMVIIYWQNVKMLLYQVSIPGAGNSAWQEWCVWGEARATPCWIKPSPVYPPQDTTEESIFKYGTSTPTSTPKMLDGERRREQSAWCLSCILTAKFIIPEVRSEMLLVLVCF